MDPNDDFNILSILDNYFNQMLTKCGSGMKALLLDTLTTQSIAVITSQTSILSREVYLMQHVNPNLRPENIKAAREAALEADGFQANPMAGRAEAPIGDKMPHLKGVVFVRPMEENLRALCRELSSGGRFSEYHIFFTNVLHPSFLSQLAEADTNQLVRQVHEFPFDTIPITGHLFSLNLPSAISNLSAADSKGAPPDVQAHFRRELEGVKSVLLSLKRRVTTVRCSAGSAAAKRLGKEVARVYAGSKDEMGDEFFHFRDAGNRNPLLVIVDRADDPVTPLLTQWTYQAMVHELLGIKNSRVKLADGPNVKKEMAEIVLNVVDDVFYRSNIHCNYGEIIDNVQGLTAEYKANSKMNNDIKSIEQMQSFLERFPQYKAQGHIVEKHVAILGQLREIVDAVNLMGVSEFEQQLACDDNRSEHLKKLLEMIEDAAYKGVDKLRLAVLYCLRYEKSGDVQQIKDACAASTGLDGKPDVQGVELIDQVLRYAGAAARGPTATLLYGKGALSQMTKLLGGGKADESIFTRHTSLVVNVLKRLQKGILYENHYTTVFGNKAIDEDAVGDKLSRKMGVDAAALKDIPKDIIMYVLGGATYEEAKAVEDYNRENGMGIKVLLGGSTMLNSQDFIAEIKNLGR